MNENILNLAYAKAFNLALLGIFIKSVVLPKNYQSASLPELSDE